MIPALLLLAPLVGADVAGEVGLFFRRPAPAQRAPVIIELRGNVDIEATGAVITRARDGRALGHDRWIAARASPSEIAALSALPQVARIEADGSPFAWPDPLAATANEIQAPDVWAQRSDSVPLAGAGMILCDIDSGIDVFHPLFFRADGGYHAWIDEDGNGAFTPGVDSAGGSTLHVLDGYILGPYSNAPIFGSASAELDAAFDWLYADLNDNGVRDYGRAADFDDSTPAFGEPLFVVDDVNRNGRLDRDEKLVALGSSKIRVVHTIDTAYVRGQNLIDAPAMEAAHGTASASVLVGGNRGLGRIVGIAPDAELVVMLRGPSVNELYAFTSACITEGARVVLHEYAPWQGFFLDGSSPLEALIDSSSRAGVA
ncbi:MAG TPA: hypothetical protein VFB62_23795, partial [Polyangiaceae bacterium]|nr:hypothetical protein [Polyangiaceae bacterium]